MNRVIPLSLLALTLAGACAPATAQVVVVGANSPATALSADQAAALFLGQTSTLPGAGNALIVDQAEAQAIRERFYSKATGKSPSQVKAMWSRLMFSGKVTAPPKELANNAEVKKFLATDPNAVGYIDKEAVDASVRVLLSLN